MAPDRTQLPQGVFSFPTKTRIPIVTKNAAPAKGHHPQALRVTGDLVFVTGQTARDGEGNIVGRGDIRAQTRQVLKNIRAIVEAAGGTMNDVVKITIYLRDMKELPAVTEVRREYFTAIPPASTSVEVSRLASDDYLIEIEAIAVV